MICAHIYCRAPMGDRAICPRCGHPADAARLRDPTFLMQAAAAVPSRGGPVTDMHQILPAHPMALTAQLMVMQGLGIEHAVLQSVPPEASSLQGNAALAEVKAEHPERFTTSWYIDPRDDGALDELDRATERGAQLIKLLPVAGYRLDDPAFHDFLARAQAQRLTLLVHTGFITARHKAEEHAAGRFFNASLGDPLQVDEPARRFPDLQIIVAHSGGAIFYEAGAQLLTQHDNVWGDVSGFGLFALQRWLRLGVSLDWSKVFWGNDAPFFHYPANLRLLLDVLEQAGAERLTRPLLHDNGARFRERHLS